MVPTSSLNLKVGILTGPTATGKTGLALELTSQYGNIEIINADSMLVYQGMDIGTAKPSRAELSQIPHHLIDIHDPADPFTAGDFVRTALPAIEEIHGRGKRALIVGGTGFYLKALLYGLWEGPKTDLELRARLEKIPQPELFKKLTERDPISAQRIGPNDRYRIIRAIEIIDLSGKTPTELQAEQPKEPDPRFELWIIDRATPELVDRIQIRTRAMLDAGLIDEVKRIREIAPASRALDAVGYAEVCQHLDGKRPEGRKIAPGMQGLFDEIVLGTRQLIKKQRTWFKGQHQAQVFLLDEEREALARSFQKIYGTPSA